MKNFSYLVTGVLIIIGLFYSCISDNDSFEPDENGTFTDSRDNEVYNSIKIGDITWMKENLRYDAGVGSWIFEDDDFYLESYGRLYTWEVAQNVCPSGWELPTNNDWELLANFVAEDQGDFSMDGNHYLNIAKYLKASSGWAQNNGKDNYGFQAYAGGMRFADGTYNFTGTNGFWWSLDAYDSADGWYWNMDAEDQTLYTYIGEKEYGFSVKCINRTFSIIDDSGDEKPDEFKCNIEFGSFTDSRDDHTYKTTKVCEQTWMAENLAYLPQVSPPSVKSSSEALFYVYGYEGYDVSDAKATDNYEKYGVLYNWPAALNVCPSGWHLPTNDEWLSFESNIESGGHENLSIALRSTTGWLDNGNGTDDFGFTILPSGMTEHGTFNRLGYDGYYLTASESDEDRNRGRIFFSDKDERFYSAYYKSSGGGVRCVKD